MVDMEMDLDTRNHGDVEHIHDDPIDYDLDIDLTNENGPSWDGEDIEIGEAVEELPEMNMQMEGNDDVDHDIPSDAMDTLEAGVTAGVARSDADMLSNVDPDDNIAMVHDIAPEEMPTDIVEDVAIVESTIAPPEVPEPVTTASEYVELSDIREENAEEITYEETEEANVEEDVLLKETNGLAKEDGNAAAVPLDEATGLAEEGDNDSSKEEVAWGDDNEETEQASLEGESALEHDAAEEDAQEPMNGQHDAAEPDVTYEQTYEQEGDTEQQDEEGYEHAQKAADQEPTEATHPEDEQHEEVGVGQETHVDDSEVQATAPIDTLVDEVGAAENASYDETETGIHAEDLNHIAQGDEILAEDGYWPAITVQYKGDEFPCFAAADGFFTNASVAEESMEKVLAGLRTELAAELAEDEELVFHVDELGLEFAESTQRELLSTTTLRSILDLYEMLVQNQDQDAHPKPLYTYLFTRSSPNKRLEYLMESAANGRGLDEVIHLFEPAILHSHETSHDGESEDLDHEHDEYPSQVEAPDADTDETLVAAVGTEEVLASNSQQGTEAANHTEGVNESYEEDTTLTYPGNEQDVIAENVAEEDGVEADSAHMLVTETQLPLAEDVAEEDVVEVGNITVTAEEEATAGCDGEEAHLQHGTEQPEVTDAPQTDSENHHDTEQDDAINSHQEAENENGLDAANGKTMESSATSTMLDGTEAIGDELTYDEYTDENIHTKPEGQDDLGEIDWQDDEDEEVVAVTEQSPSAKRTRTEDELDVIEENDTKRQRSS